MDSVDLILIAEDDDNLRFLVMHQLKKLGFRAHYATTGIEAVLMAQEHHYSVIFMDLMMPEMDGIAAAKAIRTNEQQQNRPRVPIIAMTAYQNNVGCTEAGMDGFLFKPVMLDDLSHVLTQWLPGAPNA